MSFTKIIRAGNVEFVEWIIDNSDIEVTTDSRLDRDRDEIAKTSQEICREDETKPDQNDSG